MDYSLCDDTGLSQALATASSRPGAGSASDGRVWEHPGFAEALADRGYVRAPGGTWSRPSCDPAPVATKAQHQDQAIGASVGGGGGKASAIDSASPSAQHQPNPLDVAIGLGLGACLTRSTALSLEGAWLGAGTFTLIIACILACLHQDSRA